MLLWWLPNLVKPSKFSLSSLSWLGLCGFGCAAPLALHSSRKYNFSLVPTLHSCTHPCKLWSCFYGNITKARGEKRCPGKILMRNWWWPRVTQGQNDSHTSMCVVVITATWAGNGFHILHGSFWLWSSRCIKDFYSQGLLSFIACLTLREQGESSHWSNGC